MARQLVDRRTREPDGRWAASAAADTTASRVGRTLRGMISRGAAMPHRFLAPAVATLCCLAVTAAGATQLIAVGTLTGSSAGANVDLSGLTAPLENGVAGNLLGGLGSGFAWAGGNTFVAVPDRGPNAVSYNGLVDDTTSYISRFQ